MQKRATITSKGQITVPREVRRMLGVRSGDKLLFESDGKGVWQKEYWKVAARDEGRMTTAVDTNVVIALWDKDPTLSLAAQNALDAAFNRGTLVAAAPVFAELIAAPGRSEKFVGSFFEETGIGVDWELSEQIWRLAGRAFQGYAERRRKQRDKAARRILADFIIGAHAFANGFRLLTLDEGLYRAAFPSLAIETF
jgi:AbrB family looped-hinge helix DNA binding protein